MYRIKLLALILSVVGFISCKNADKTIDASGVFEADETIISSELQGKLLEFNVKEGMQLNAGDVVGHIDSTQTILKIKQLQAQIKASAQRKPDVYSQSAVYDRQIATLNQRIATLYVEQKRMQKLVAGDAAPRKQLDDIDAQISELKKQVETVKQQKLAQISALNTQISSIESEPLPVQVQIDQLKDQLSKSKIINPINGTVLASYTEQFEITASGKPLYKIADISNLTLRAYITSDQLGSIKLGMPITVMIDSGKGYKNYIGKITWISNKSEFTPKSIQTKNERANTVYAIKVNVANDGYLKIGMYADIKF